jgi:hypothetical protein
LIASARVHELTGSSGAPWEVIMTSLCPLDRSLVAKLKSQLKFIEFALESAKQKDIGHKAFVQMHRAIVAVQGLLKSIDVPELEAFVCDLGDLLQRTGQGKITPSIRLTQLIRRGTHALRSSFDAIEAGLPATDALSEARAEILSFLLDDAVTVKQ